MHIAFIGYGSMAASLATRFVRFDETTVTIAGRDPAKAEALAAQVGGSARAVASTADAVRAADAVVIATPHGAVFDAIAAAGGADAFAGKIVVDINNPVPGYAEGDFTLGTYGSDGTPGGGHLSLSEAIQSVLPDAKVVKAFNTAQAEVWKLDPMHIDGRPFVFPVCGDDADAKAAVAGWVSAMGGGTWDAGGIAYAPQIESLAAMTIQLLFSGRGALTVFNLLEDEA
ncbi:MAG: NAD(P)-binding domain-containing protein [Planctomycetota bacterium]